MKWFSTNLSPTSSMLGIKDILNISIAFDLVVCFLEILFSLDPDIIHFYFLRLLFPSWVPLLPPVCILKIAVFSELCS